jgi:ubiquinone/menaquinone biosynthesis C-methylase UbiE
MGVDRSPAMLAEMGRRYPKVPVVLGDAHRLPFREGVVDLTVFVTTLEFLEDPRAAVSEGVAVARQGMIILVLNRWSVGGLSRRWGPQARHPVLGQARDYTLASLGSMVRKAAGQRWRGACWASTLFPDGFWKIRASVPLGDVIGMAVRLAPPTAS